MDVFHISSAYVAKEAEVSIKTVERIKNGNCDQDIMRGTFRRIEIVVFGSANNHICCLDFEASNASEKIASLEAEKADLLKKVAHLLEENERYAKIIDKYLE